MYARSGAASDGNDEDNDADDDDNGNSWLLLLDNGNSATFGISDAASDDAGADGCDDNGANCSLLSMDCSANCDELSSDRPANDKSASFEIIESLEEIASLDGAGLSPSNAFCWLSFSPWYLMKYTSGLCCFVSGVIGGTISSGCSGFLTST